MADNVVFQSSTLATPPSSTTVATDDVSGAQYQRVKLDVGGDGASVPVTNAAPLPIGTLPGGTVQGHGTFQVLGSVQGVGTFQVLGTVQTHGTSQALGTFQPLAGSVHLAAGSVNAQGVIAHGAAIAGNPLLWGAFGSSGTQAAVSDGQFTRLWADLNGRLQVRGTIDSLPNVTVSSMPTTTVTGTVQTHGTSQVLGTVQTHGTSQVLGSVQTVGTSQVLGSVQAVGTTQTRNAPGTLMPSRTRVGITNGAITQLLGANATRVGFSLYAEGTSFHIQYGTTAGTFDYSFILAPGMYFEDPYRHVGSISAFGTAAGGSVMITEF